MKRLLRNVRFQFFVGLLSAVLLTADALPAMSGWGQACWLAGMLLAARLARHDRSAVFRTGVALSYVQRIFRKLGVQRRRQLLRLVERALAEADG